jgi:HlyD family secretion protein
MAKGYRKIIYSGLILTVCLLPLLLFSCKHRKGKTEKPKSSTTVELRDVRREVVATGAVKPKVGAQVKVGARISGKLERLMVQAGDQVKQGQLIAVIRHQDLEARVERLTATLKGLRIRQKEDLKEISEEMAETRAKLRLSRLDLKRYSALFKKGYVAKAEVDKAQRDVGVLSAQLAALKRKYQSTNARYLQEISQTEAQLKEAKVYLSYAFVKAPISGTVSSVTTTFAKRTAPTPNTNTCWM